MTLTREITVLTHAELQYITFVSMYVLTDVMKDVIILVKVKPSSIPVLTFAIVRSQPVHMIIALYQQAHLVIISAQTNVL